MDKSAISSRYALALQLIRDAGDLAHDYFRRRESLTVNSKGPQDMASEADVNTELLIRDRLGKAFPDDGFLGEETGRRRARSRAGTVGRRSDRRDPALHQRPVGLVRVHRLRPRQRADVRDGVCAGAGRAVCRRPGHPGDPERIPGREACRQVHYRRHRRCRLLAAGHSGRNFFQSSGGCSKQEECSIGKAPALSPSATWLAAA